MKVAVKAIQGGAKLRQTAALYSIPVMTLSDYVTETGTSRIVNFKKMGKKPVFTSQQENEIKEHILLFCRKFYGLTPDSLKSSVFEYAERNKIKNPFNKASKQAGKDWMYHTSRKAEKEKEFQTTKKFINIDKYITTKNQDLNVASTSGIQMNASVVEPLSDKTDQIAAEDIAVEVSRSEETSYATITNAAQDDSIGDVQKQILDEISTVVPNISDPATWPLNRNNKIIDKIIDQWPSANSH